MPMEFCPNEARNKAANIMLITMVISKSYDLWVEMTQYTVDTYQTNNLFVPQ